MKKAKKIKNLDKWDKKKKNRYGLYECHCGNEFEALNCNINSGNTKTCGCSFTLLLNETRKKTGTGHGLTRTKVHRAWLSMRRRCYNKKDIQYKDYGGRGIRVCKKWKNDFMQFFNDMGHPPTDKHSLDRIDVSKNYSKENCKWSTYKEQANNKINTIYIIYNGEKKTIRQLADDHGLTYKFLYGRLRAGWDIEKALHTPKLQ